MRSLTLALDALPALRGANHTEVDVAAAATLAELAGVDTVRLAVNEDLSPVSESDVLAVRRATRSFELQMPASPALLKIALGVRPDRVVLANPGRDGRSPAAPLDLRAPGSELAPVVRVLDEAGIPSAVAIVPRVDAVKAAHVGPAGGVEFFTGAIVDLPEAEWSAELDQLADAVKLAAKLRLAVGLAGRLGYRELPRVLEAVPAVERVAVGRAAMARALLVGIDRAVRDLRSLVV